MICLTLFWNFLMIGTLSFGGGYGMISLVREVVLGHGWLTESEFLSFIAVSESTPGPLAVNMATFIGSSQAGLPGALVATLGVVLAVLCHHPAGGGGAAQRAPVRRGTGSAGRGAPLCGGHDPGHGGHDGPFHAGRLYGRPGGRLCTGRPGHCGVCAAGAGALRVQKNTAESTIPHWDDPAFCRTGHRVLALRRAQPSGCCFSSCRMARNCSGTLSSGISRSTSTVPAACAVS